MLIDCKWCDHTFYVTEQEHDHLRECARKARRTAVCRCDACDNGAFVVDGRGRVFALSGPDSGP